MDKNYLFSIFNDDIEKIVRDYIFYLDEIEKDSSINKYHFDKNYDFVKVYNFRIEGENALFDYLIVDRSGEPTVFEKPVSMVVPTFYLMVSMYKYLKIR